MAKRHRLAHQFHGAEGIVKGVAVGQAAQGMVFFHLDAQLYRVAQIGR